MGTLRVFVTGGTGFVGAEVLKRLVSAGHQARALVREASGHGTGSVPRDVEVVRGDALDPGLARQMEGMDAVIHLVGIIRAFPSRGVTFERFHVEATRNVIDAAKAAGVRRLVHMSALGADPGGPTDYFRTKWEAETAVKDSGLDWTVMKPSVIYGPRDEFVNMLARQVRYMPVVPVIGDGKYRLQPVSVGNVADGFVKSLVMESTKGKTFEVGGPEELSYDEMLDRIAQALGRRRAIKVHLPLGPMRMMVRLMQGIELFPVTDDQIEMLLMNNVCDGGPYFAEFGIEPVGFDRGIREYIR